MSAKEMFKKLGYRLDEEPEYGAEISYTKYCCDGCCIRNQIVFYKTGIDCDECFITYELLQAINQQINELGWK